MTTLIDLIGAVDNLSEPEPALNKRSAILGLVISFQLLTWMCVLFRLYTRFIIIKMPWWDDLFVVLSSVRPGLAHSSQLPFMASKRDHRYPQRSAVQQ